MRIFLSGLDFTKSPELFRHLQNPEPSLLSQWVSRLRSRSRKPLVFLLTCDRFEIYSLDSPYPHESAERVLSLNPAIVKSFRYSMEGEEAIRHLFLLSSGIISPLFGEDTIISQLAISSTIARSLGSSSPYLEKLFNMAVAFGKKCHTKLNLREFEPSVLEDIKRIIGSGRDVLIVGSGEWARCIAEGLKDENRVAMTLRDEEKIFLLPPSVKSIAYDDRKEHVSGYDVIISSSSGLYHTFESEDKALFDGRILFDLASPEDIPSSLSPIRLDMLPSELANRERNEEKVRAWAEERLSEYISWLDGSLKAPDVNIRSELLAGDVIRRLQGPIGKLSLDNEKEKDLQEAIYETVRKAYMGSELSRKQ